MSDQTQRKHSPLDRVHPPQPASIIKSIRKASITDTRAPSIRPSLVSPAQKRPSQLLRAADGERRESTDHIATSAPPPKVAIPRLKRDNEGQLAASSKSGGRHRINHACEPCRQRKTKCSGERPVCKHCQDFKISCYYADGKRDRVKKQFGSMSEKVQDYEILLRELMDRVEDDDIELIKRALEKDVTQEDEESPSIPDSAFLTMDGDAEAGESDGESVVSGTCGSIGAVDRVEEDFNRSEKARAAGFIGKNSEITWMQRLKQETQLEDSNTELDGEASKERAEAFSVGELSYQLDDFPISIPETLDPYELPPRDVAENLFDVFMTSVHPNFPILGKVTFTNQFRKVFNEAGGATRINPGIKWLAIVNMIFAISAKYSHLTLAEWRGDERDHLLYFTRAKLFSMNGETLFNHPDLQQVQISGLTAFYLMAISQINRAWIICGMATRAAIALGVNMRSESPSTPDTSKEMRYRVWWSLYTLEHSLNAMTGRPTSVMDHVCTAPLPVPYDEDNFQNPNAIHLLSGDMQKGSRLVNGASPSSSGAVSTPPSEHSRSASKGQSRSPSLPYPQPDWAKGAVLSKTPSRSPPIPRPQSDWAKGAAPSNSLYFLHYVLISRINQEILNLIYTPSAMKESWSTIQSYISDVNRKLQTWHSSLPGVFDFARKQRDQTFLRQRLILGFVCYSTRISINRPCLCRLDRKIPNQSGHSKDFDRNAAAACVMAAKDMLDMIPDEPNAVGLYQVAPWWCVLHYLMQATVVIMLELSFRAHHMPEEADSLLDASKKGIRWLHHMGQENVAAQRAWSFCNRLIRDAAAKVGRNANDLPCGPPVYSQASSYDSAGEQQMQDSMHHSKAPARHPIQDHVGDYQMQASDLLNASMFTNYDEYVPQGGQTSSEVIGTFFPTATEMEYMNVQVPHFYNMQGYGTSAAHN